MTETNLHDLIRTLHSLSLPAWLVEAGFHWGGFGSGWEEGDPTSLDWRQRRTWSYSGTDLSSLYAGGKLLDKQSQIRNRAASVMEQGVSLVTTCY